MEVCCLDCGLPYGGEGWLDTGLPLEQWRLIHPAEGGILCANCITARASKLPHVIRMVTRIEFAKDVATRFWMVWSPRGGSPKYKHSSLESAQVEAKRLSQKFNGRHFYILECVDVAMEGPEIPTEKQAARAARMAAAAALQPVSE